MKKWIAIILAVALVMSMAACGANNELSGVEPTPSVATANPAPTETAVSSTPPNVADDNWEAQAEAAVSTALDALSSEYESLVANVDDYASYVEHRDEIAAFYETINTTSANLCVTMRAFALNYAEYILASDKPTDDMYDDMDDVYDLVYDDMSDEIYDGIYDGIFDDLYDDLYGDALDDRPDDVEYEDWSDARSEEYDRWSDTRSDTYDHWSDFRSDVYDFWSDTRSELWADDFEGALERLVDFRDDIEKLDGQTAIQLLPAGITADIPTATDGDNWESKAKDEITDIMSALTSEYESLVAEVDDYASYMEKYEDVVFFYEKIITASGQMCIEMRTLSADYAESILQSDKSTDDMYDALDEIYDLVYNDISDEIYDSVYNGIMDDVYDSFYNGALDDLPDDVKYEEWSDALSKEYEMWSDVCSETYEQWSDYCSDIYDFWSDIRSELLGDELENAWDELESFREDIEELRGELAVKADTPPEEPTDVTGETVGEGIAEKDISNEFKAAMDSYEEFMDEYVEFMKKFNENPTDVSFLLDYADYMKKYAEFVEDFEAWQNKEMNTEEALYYLDVQTRVNKKLLEVLE